eukprot:588686-Rhodomonas_salina.1
MTATSDLASALSTLRASTELSDALRASGKLVFSSNHKSESKKARGGWEGTQIVGTATPSTPDTVPMTTSVRALREAFAAADEDNDGVLSPLPIHTRDAMSGSDTASAAANGQVIQFMEFLECLKTRPDVAALLGTTTLPNDHMALASRIWESKYGPGPETRSGIAPLTRATCDVRS